MAELLCVLDAAGGLLASWPGSKKEQPSFKPLTLYQPKVLPRVDSNFVLDIQFRFPHK
jgi:hypothetical protein